MKKCPKCGIEKPHTDFYRDKHKPSGRKCYCKTCCSIQQKHSYSKKKTIILARCKEYRDEHQEERRIKGRVYYRKYRDRFLAYKKKRRIAYPERTKSHDKVHRAIKSGRLIPEPCEECGQEEGIQAHHDDYTKPLDVRWLCRSCHKYLHVGVIVSS